MPDPTDSSARNAVIISRGVALDRIVLAAVVLLPIAITISGGLAVGVFFGVFALPAAVLGLRNVLRQPPLLRGDERGLWCGRGRIVPWREVKLIYETGVGPRRAFEGIAFEFVGHSTWFRLPIERQVAWMFSYGEVSVTTRYVTEVSRTALVARLQGLRTRAIGNEDGVAIGAAEIPSARVVER